MLHVVKGSSPQGIKKAHDIVAALQKKRPEAEVFTFSELSWSADKFSSLLSAQGLFESKYIVLLDRVLSAEGAQGAVFENLKMLAEAEHAFVLYEEKILAAELKKLEKHAFKVYEISAPVLSEKKEQFNLFGLTDALGARDKKKAWILFNEALHREIAAEEIHGVIWWQIKSILLASGAKSAAETGLNPFVYKKAKQYAGNFSTRELTTISEKLVDMYHQAHRGEADFLVELERFVLEI
ncbi:MAG: hypothetical protein PHF79_03455 [Candidatus Pacebacteria bacterium]|nr:hypothetical protein [Candidatus Paceibacterota bacterium]